MAHYNFPVPEGVMLGRGDTFNSEDGKLWAVHSFGCTLYCDWIQHHECKDNPFCKNRDLSSRSILFVSDLIKVEEK